MCASGFATAPRAARGAAPAAGVRWAQEPGRSAWAAASRVSPEPRSPRGGAPPAAPAPRGLGNDSPCAGHREGGRRSQPPSENAVGPALVRAGVRRGPPLPAKSRSPGVRGVAPIPRERDHGVSEESKCPWRRRTRPPECRGPREIQSSLLDTTHISSDYPWTRVSSVKVSGWQRSASLRAVPTDARGCFDG